MECTFLNYKPKVNPLSLKLLLVRYFIIVLRNVTNQASTWLIEKTPPPNAIVLTKLIWAMQDLVAHLGTAASLLPPFVSLHQELSQNPQLGGTWTRTSQVCLWLSEAAVRKSVSWIWTLRNTGSSSRACAVCNCFKGKAFHHTLKGRSVRTRKGSANLSPHFGNPVSSSFICLVLL